MQMDIIEAAKHAGLSPTYIRYLVRHGKLKSRKAPIGPGLVTEKHIIESKDLDKFLSETRTRSRRADHRNKYNMYATPDELEKAVEVLRKAKLDDVAASIRPANFIKGFPNGDTRHPEEEEA